MPANVPIVSSLLVLVLVSILSSTYGELVGQSCTVDNTPGVCKLLINCTKVYEELLAGILPKKTCGYTGFDPIICCPAIDRPTPTPMPTPTPLPQSVSLNELLLSKVNRSRGSLARTMCAENAKAVYAFMISPLSSKPVNVSLCGLTTRKLIISGPKAEAKEFPHMAAVGFNSPNGILWNCSGSLISSKIVLTAAHCIWTQDWGNASWVRLGDLNLAQTNDNAMPQTIAIKDRIRHPEYKRPSKYHDIAILRLEKEAVYNAFVRPACLPVDLPDVDQDNKAISTGWGLLPNWYNDTDSRNLIKITLNLVPRETCNASYGISSEFALGIVDEWQICAGNLRLHPSNPCQDNGGPLTVFSTDHNCMYNIIGVTSLGRLCDSVLPGVYTRVYNYIPWIESTAWPEYF